MADAIDSELAPTAQASSSEGTNLLGTLGNNAPFVGLFGTVLGVIEAFHQLGATGQNKDAMGNVMAGIAEALVATGVGLFVALPAVVAYNVVQKKIGEIEDERRRARQAAHGVRASRSARQPELRALEAKADADGARRDVRSPSALQRRREPARGERHGRNRRQKAAAGAAASSGSTSPPWSTWCSCCSSS